MANSQLKSQQSTINQNALAQLKEVLPDIPSVATELKRESAISIAGPCLRCGGTDRFVYRYDTARFHCRKCHADQGDIIDFHCWLNGTDIKGLLGMYLPPEQTSCPPADRALIQYLTGRGIDSKVVQQAVESGYIWEQAFQGNTAIACRYTDLKGNGQGNRTVQYIPTAGGKKKFKRGSKPSEDFFILGDPAADTIVLTEAVINALSVAGEIENACIVALGGSTFTRKIQTLKGKRKICFFDNDRAGEKARDAVGKIDPDARTVRWLTDDPTGHDPNELLKSGQSHRIKEMIEATEAIHQEVEPIPPEKIKERARQILRDREPPEVFNMNVIPELLRDYVEEICRRTDADPVMVLMSVLCSMSAIVGRRAYIPEGAYFTRLYVNLWAFIQSLSGGFKTTALNKGCRIAWQKEAEIQKSISALKEEKARLIESDASEKQQKAKKKGIDKEIRELQAQSCILPNRMSGEGLLELLADGQAGLIPASEFGEWLDNLAKNHNQGLKPLFTDLYDVPQQYSYKTRGGGHLIIQRPFISICGMSTAEWVRDNITLGDVGSGFFARFLLFCPPQKRTIPPALPRIQAPFDCEAEEEIKRRLDTLCDDHPFRLSVDASNHFEAVHRAIYDALKQLDERDQELLAPYAKRWSPYVLKLAAIFQVAIEPDECIGAAAVRAGAAVVEYAIKSTVFLFKHELGMSPFQRSCDRILEYIAKQGGSVSRHKILASHMLEGGAKEYDDVLTTLDEQNKITTIPAKHRKYETVRLTGDEFETV